MTQPCGRIAEEIKRRQKENLMKYAALSRVCIYKELRSYFYSVIVEKALLNLELS
jgi:hypothetical protein